MSRLPIGESRRPTPYETWIRIFDEAPERDRARHAERLSTLAGRPLISILIVLTSADPVALERLARSAAGQIYPAWELLLAAPQAEHDAVCESLVTHGLDCGRLRLVNAGADEAALFVSTHRGGGGSVAYIKIVPVIF